MRGINLLKRREFIPADFFCLKWEAESFVQGEWAMVSIESVIEKCDKVTVGDQRAGQIGACRSLFQRD